MVDFEAAGQLGLEAQVPSVFFNSKDPGKCMSDIDAHFFEGPGAIL